MKNLTILKTKELLDKGEFTPTDLLDYYYSQIEKKDKEINSFITLNKEESYKKAKLYDKSKKLSGIPIAVKDVFSTKDLKTTCASKILENYIPAYESTVTSKLLDEDAIFIGKTNLDQFCQGSSTETSYYGPTRNPWDTSRLPGGSSGGSAVAVSADFCSGSLGTETAGSIRQPSSWCGCVGIKPTYGRVSRYGVLAMGSSLDSPGPITKDVDDAALILSLIAGNDKHDFSSSNEPVINYLKEMNPKRIKGIKLGLPKEFMDLDLDEGVRKNTLESIKLLKSLGAQVVDVELLDPKFAMAVYTIICRSEVSSNLSRYDGSRYCIHEEDQDNVLDYFEKVRGVGFGEEAKRRILTGIFSLSAGYSAQFFKKADLVREVIKNNIIEVLTNVDAIIGPTTPCIALPVGSAQNNPLFGEMMDILAETSSLTGSPAISIPNGFYNGLPTGLQFIGRHFDEQLLIDLAKAYELEFGKIWEINV